MGFFNKIKNVFTNTIEKTSEMDDALVTLYGFKKSKLKVNRKLIVDKDYCVVFVVGDKVCDVLPAGSYTLNNQTLPVSFKKCRMDKATKKGKYPSKFSVDIYFVNLKKFKDMEFRSVYPFRFKSQMFGKVKGRVEGFMDIRVLDAETFIKTLLLELPYIKKNQARRYANAWISDEVNDIIENSVLGFGRLLVNPREMYNTINETLLPRMEEYGLEVSNFRSETLVFPKKLQKKVSDYILENKETMQQITDNLLVSDEGEVIESLDKEIIENINTLNVEELVETPAFSDENTERGGATDTLALRRSSSAQDLQVKSSSTININAMKPDVQSEFELAEDMKQCKYCDNMIGVEFTYCPYCGFKQD